MQPEVHPPQDTTPEAPRATVIIVSFNCVEALRATLTALNAAEGRDRLEVQVVDAGSRDGCAQIDTEFDNVHVQRLPRNFGRTRTRNIGVKTARAELIVLMDAGVCVAPKTIAALADALEADSHAVAAVATMNDANGRKLAMGAMLPDVDELATCCKDNRDVALTTTGAPLEYAGASVVMVKQAFLRGMNYFDERRFGEYGAELELFWQIRNAAKRVLVVDTAPATRVDTKSGVRTTRAGQAVLAADRVAGYGSYVMRHYGFATGVAFRVKLALHALGKVFSEPGYGVRLLRGILTLERVDGTQTHLLS